MIKSIYLNVVKLTHEHNDFVDKCNRLDTLKLIFHWYIPFLLKIHNKIDYLKSNVAFLMDIDNTDRSHLFVFDAKHDINDDNVLVFENNLNQVLYQHKIVQIFQY